MSSNKTASRRGKTDPPPLPPDLAASFATLSHLLTAAPSPARVRPTKNLQGKRRASVGHVPPSAGAGDELSQKSEDQKVSEKSDCPSRGGSGGSSQPEYFSIATPAAMSHGAPSQRPSLVLESSNGLAGPGSLSDFYECREESVPRLLQGRSLSGNGETTSRRRATQELEVSTIKTRGSVNVERDPLWSGVFCFPAINIRHFLNTFLSSIHVERV